MSSISFSDLVCTDNKQTSLSQDEINKVSKLNIQVKEEGKKEQRSLMSLEDYEYWLERK